MLGGGGVVGIAWETGVLAGLRAAGTDVTNADLFVGTSAGSTVGAQVASGRDLDELLALQLGPSDGLMEALSAEIDFGGILELFGWLAEQTQMGADQLREIGSRALAARTPSEHARLAMVATRLGVTEWPDKELRVTAIDCETGEFVWWDAAGAASLVEAVASSSAVPTMFAPVTIAGRRYFDGGFRSTTCAGLAVGFERVVIVAPIVPPADGFGALIAAQIDTEVKAIEAAGGQALRIHPDAEALDAFGPNLMDPARRSAAADAGLCQGRSHAAAVATLWG